jgi:uncharacterized protein (UPF0548 family)
MVTYPEVGATRDGPLPAGYTHLRHRVRLPADAYPVAGEAVLTWRMHRAAGVRMETPAPRAAPGVTLRAGLGIGPLRLWVPCEVVWVVDTGERTGFGYGTLPGHPESGEESFVVTREADGTVWFTVRAFSRPARWFTRAGGPVVPACQRVYAWGLGRTLRRLCRTGPPDRG